MVYLLLEIVKASEVGALLLLKSRELANNHYLEVNTIDKCIELCLETRWACLNKIKKNNEKNMQNNNNYIENS